MSEKAHAHSPRLSKNTCPSRSAKANQQSKQYSVFSLLCMGFGSFQGSDIQACLIFVCCYKKLVKIPQKGGMKARDLCLRDLHLSLCVKFCLIHSSPATSVFFQWPAPHIKILRQGSCNFVENLHISSSSSNISLSISLTG